LNIFVSGAVTDRAAIFTRIVASGLRIALYGDYWERCENLRKYHRGRAEGALLRRATGAAPVKYAYVAAQSGRACNAFGRDFGLRGVRLQRIQRGIARFSGKEDECVLYFANGREAVEKTRWALRLREMLA
jgi:hypothetical protein